MYHVTFICDDRNGDDGVYNPVTGETGTVTCATAAEAARIAANDADTHAEMYAGTAERHWHGAFCDTAAHFHTAHAITSIAELAPHLRNGYAFSVEGDDDGTGHPWRLGEYRITYRDTCTAVIGTTGAVCLIIPADDVSRILTAMDIIRDDDDTADDTERAAIVAAAHDAHVAIASALCAAHPRTATCAYCL